MYLMPPTCYPVKDSLVKLLMLVDACGRASALTITEVRPYYGYARVDRKTVGRVAITAS